MIFFDLETRSSVDLKKSNVYRYVTAPDFEVLMCAWTDGIRPVEVALGQDILGIPGLLDPAVLKVAHNAAFDRVALSAMSGLPEGTYLPPSSFIDTMAMAAEAGYPRSLGKLAAYLGGEQKDEAGTRLINLFSKPNRKGEYNSALTHPEQWSQFVEYCRQDVETLVDVYWQLPESTPREREVYIVDQHINDRGMLVDTTLARAAVEAAEENQIAQELEFSVLTGVVNPSSTQQVMQWFEEVGFPLPNLQKATVEAALDRAPTEDIRRALELRLELALVASKKYIAALDRVNSDDRLRGSLQYFGAHTGRWAGRGVQLQNLPSATIDGEDVDAAISEEVNSLLLGNPAPANTLKALVRSMFLGPFTVVDYSAIEARVLAWLADERWALKAFADGRDIYVETASQMGPQYGRKQGKVATLALGYNGGVNSLRAMGAEGSDPELQQLVTTWREVNPAIVGLWADLQQAFWTGGSAGKLYVEVDGDSRRIVLPSGRALVYHEVRRTWKENAWQKRVPQLSFYSPQGFRQETYGGRLAENATQAVARDVLADALVALERRGYRCVSHVHDEILVEGDHPVDEVSAIMTSSSPWAVGLPLAAEGYTCPRYRKG